MGSFARETLRELRAFLVFEQAPSIGRKSLKLDSLAMFKYLSASCDRKAFAKFCYGWGKMQGGDSWFALQAMSGFKSFVGWTARDQKWKKKTLKEDWAHGKTENARGRKINYKCVLVSNGSH